MNIQSHTVIVAGLLETLYEWAFGLFNSLLKLMQFNHMTEAPGVAQAAANMAGASVGASVGVQAGGQKVDWTPLWGVAKNCFTVLKDITIPIATIFFIVAIYKAVISKPPEEQFKQFFMESLKFIMVLFIAGNLFEFLTLITQITEGITDAVLSKAQPNFTDSKFFDDGKQQILTAIQNYDNPKLEDLCKGDILVFCEKIFTFLIYFLGGLGTIIIYGKAGFSIVMATIERIVKPLLMIPFSTIVVGIGACSEEGERMIWNYLKNFLAFSLSGVFILIAVNMGSALSGMPIFDLSGIVNMNNGVPSDAGEYIISALVALFRINIPMLITSGLVKSADSFMSRVFG
ncbi:MAG: type IV secretion system protein [Pseudobutyrivibrio sp.]|nr:type IV secretion system protein [Pseudobutyrivibrio sp.]